MFDSSTFPFRNLYSLAEDDRVELISLERAKEKLERFAVIPDLITYEPNLPHYQYYSA